MRKSSAPRRRRPTNSTTPRPIKELEDEREQRMYFAIFTVLVGVADYCVLLL